MHNALFISEVSREICTLLDHSSLPAVARSCRALLDPALDELWRDLYSIYPFIHLLTLAHSGESHQTSVWCPSLQQWTVLRKYSARTRSLYMCMVDGWPCFDRLSCLSITPPDPDSFFPNLQTVAWYPDTHLDTLPFLRLLCGPTLTTLSAEFATDTESLAMLANLGTLCPNITDISISAASPALSNDLANALSTSISRWKDLKHVSCDDLTLPAMEHLGHMKNLESLTACASGCMSSVSRPTHTQELPFSRLQYLHLYTGLLSTTTTCLKNLRLALTEFRLDLFDAEDVFSGSYGLRELFATLAEACSHTSLVKLYFCVVHPHFPSPDIVARIRDVRPIFDFSNIRVVSLEGLPTLSLDDRDIAELAYAWPHVEELALSTYVNHPIASLPTFQSVILLVRSCPKLRTLSLVVDTTTLATPNCMVQYDVRSELLDEICFGNSPIIAPAAVSRLLHHLYPALKQVDLSVWNKEPLNRLPRRDRYEIYWGTVNMELRQLRGAES